MYLHKGQAPLKSPCEMNVDEPGHRSHTPWGGGLH